MKNSPTLFEVYVMMYSPFGCSTKIGLCFRTSGDHKKIGSSILVNQTKTMKNLFSTIIILSLFFGGLLFVVKSMLVLLIK